jgi:Ecdysteroid kinase-like family
VPLTTPDSFGEITPDWLTAVLRSETGTEGGAVVACHVEPRGAEFGFASRVARLTLTYDAPAGSAPRSLIAKLATTSDEPLRSKLLRQQCLREAAFYSRIGANAGIAIPRCYYVACDPDGSRFVLLLEDLSAHRFGDDARGCRVQDAESVVGSLAAFHARWWSNQRLSEFDWLPAFGDAALQIERLQSRRSPFLEHFGASVPTEVRKLTGGLRPHHVPLLEALQGPPVTLLHVDLHLDNIVFVGPDDDTKVVLFDWQGVSKGLGAVDLSLFVISASSEKKLIDDVRLLKCYHAALVAHGVDDYPFSQLQSDYRVALLRRWIGIVNGLGSPGGRTLTGRQAQLGRQNTVKLGSLLVNHGIPELVLSQS